jgi:hypothetical protein
MDFKIHYKGSTLERLSESKILAKNPIMRFGQIAIHLAQAQNHCIDPAGQGQTKTFVNIVYKCISFNA